MLKFHASCLIGSNLPFKIMQWQVVTFVLLSCFLFTDIKLYYLVFVIVISLNKQMLTSSDYSSTVYINLLDKTMTSAIQRLVFGVMQYQSLLQIQGHPFTTYWSKDGAN